MIKVRIQGIRFEAQDILSFTLSGIDGALPHWSPGSHVDLHLPNGMVRSYSLSDLDYDENQYRLTVQLDPSTRGGSKWMHEQLRVGQTLEISSPRNNFPLNEVAENTVFIAGGIGVTPFLSMARRLNSLKRSWTMYYSIRTPDRAAHLSELQVLASQGYGQLEINFDGIPGGKMIDLKAVIREVSTGTHCYCCGPEGMLNAFRAAGDELLPPDSVHFEYFSATVDAALGSKYLVTLAKSGKEVSVMEGQTLLNALQLAGIKVAYSCEEGICGACETRVISGTPDHRDKILSERERAENKTMMICCSGSKSDRIVLDL